MPESDQPGISVAHAAWPEVERLLAHGGIGLLPVAAAAKEHGRHLPMNADLVQAQWLVGRLLREFAVVAWPPIAYGYYPAFREYPGSISLSCQTFETLVTEVVNGILESGARHALVLNTGISTIAPLDRVSAALPQRVFMCHVYRGTRYRTVARRLARQPHGGHADELETSIMLAIAPAAVAMNRARAWLPEGLRDATGVLRRSDARDPLYAPDGVHGDPTLASAAKGTELLAAMLDDLRATLSTIANAESG